MRGKMEPVLLLQTAPLVANMEERLATRLKRMFWQYRDKWTGELQALGEGCFSTGLWTKCEDLVPSKLPVEIVSFTIESLSPNGIIKLVKLNPSIYH